eukprot:COSAG01_NODE_6271_length_3755_cov_5.711633_5_plen_77_part_00
MACCACTASEPTRAPRTVNDKTEWGAGEELNAESLAEAWRAFAAEKFQATQRRTFALHSLSTLADSIAASYTTRNG